MEVEKLPGPSHLSAARRALAVLRYIPRMHLPTQSALGGPSVTKHGSTVQILESLFLLS